jgi:hypothetical protein
MFDQLDEQQETSPAKDLARCVCYDHERSMLDRPALWIPIVMFASVFFIFAMANLPFGVQLGSIIPYTAFVALGTFSAQRGMQPYFFECSIVQQTMPRLLRRHCCFLAAIIVLETIALRLTQYMPESWLDWSGRNGSPFFITLCLFCLCFASVQVFTNRILLERAQEKSSQGAPS